MLRDHSIPTDVEKMANVLAKKISLEINVINVLKVSLWMDSQFVELKSTSDSMSLMLCTTKE